MHPRVPKSVQPILEDYVSQVNKQLPGWLKSFYLIGSIALDEFNLNFSDIDFVAILNQRATPKEIEELRAVHRMTARNHPRRKAPLVAQWGKGGSDPFSNGSILRRAV